VAPAAPVLQEDNVAFVRIALVLVSGILAHASCGAISDVVGAADEAQKSVKNEVLGGPSTCCVNGQFFECPDGSAGLQCLGEPIQMGQCIDACPQPDTNACQPACVAKHGPDPSACTRTPARDPECTKS